MDLMASLRALRRQWILTCFLLLLTFAAGVAAFVKIPGPYSAKSMVALVPSQQESKLNGNNPYLSYNGSEIIAGDIVLRQVMAPSTVVALANQGFTGSYTIVDDPNTSGPILDVTVTGKSKTVVENTLRAVTDRVQSRLSSLQQTFAPTAQLHSLVASFDPTPKLQASKKARVIVLVVGLGLVLTYAIPQILDAEISRRRARRDPGYVPPAGPGYVPPTGKDEDPPRSYEAAPHRRRYRPSTEPEQPVPDARPVARPYAERPRDMEPAPAPDLEPVPDESRPVARPYAERPRDIERSVPVPSDGHATTEAEQRPGRDTAHRREFTY
jgi:hypothetical protein